MKPEQATEQKPNKIKSPEKSTGGVKGLELKSLTEELFAVPVESENNLLGTIENIDEKTGHGKLDAYIQKRYGKEATFTEKYNDLPLAAFKRFTFDDLCKLRYSSIFTMDTSVDDLFKNNPNYRVVQKIENSMLKWGAGHGKWNEIVDAYNNIKKFVFSENKDFEIRLDYTTGNNEFGYSEHSRTFIDGALAFLVYYKGKHVMTLGFSIMENKELLLQQVQSTQRTGNRYLYQLPDNRLEYVISRFEKQFPSYNIYLIDGESLVRKTLADYERDLERTRERVKDYQDILKDKKTESKDYYAQALEDGKQECMELENRIAHLQADMPRLIEFYRNTGRYSLGTQKKVNGLIHSKVT